MAEQIFAVECGFFDAINNDRLYAADDMNRPYKRLVSNGVFASQSGSPSTDLMVEAGEDMEVTVNPGEGMFADKWFRNPAAISITVDDNTNILPRVDSIIVQVDKRSSGRVGNIVYRPGTPASTPTPPAMNTVQGVVEYRLANISVGASASAISQSDIADMRGSAECPWVAALINNPDTTTLFRQYQTAHQEYFEQTAGSFDEFIEAQKEAWSDWLDEAWSDLQIPANLLKLVSVSETVTNGNSAWNEFTVPISGYSPLTCYLMVFVNGFFVDPNRYTIRGDETGGAVSFKFSIAPYQKITFVSLSNVVTPELQTPNTIIQAMDARLVEFTQDTGWVECGVETSFTGEIEVRRIGDRVYLRGAVDGLAFYNRKIGAIPPTYVPEADHTYYSGVWGNWNMGWSMDPVMLRIDTSGEIWIVATGSGGEIAYRGTIPVDTCFVV